MRLILSLTSLVLSAVILTACDSSVTPTYQTSPENTIALQGIGTTGARAQIASVTTASGVDTTPSCRLMGPIDIGGGQSAETVLKNAITAELLQGGVYSADGTPLTVQITKLDVTTLTSGNWTLAVNVHSPKNQDGFSVETKYDFKTSFSAIAACRNAALTFNRAVSKLINDIIENPKFKETL